MKTLAFVCALASPAFAAPLIGDAAPISELPALGGGKATLHSSRVTLVDFSATWCGPCHAALDALTSIASHLDVDLVIVDVGEPAATVARFYGGRTLPKGTKVLLDEDGAVATRWGHNRFPTTFLVDEAGVVRFINRGYGAGYPARIESHVRALVR